MCFCIFSLAWGSAPLQAAVSRTSERSLAHGAVPDAETTERVGGLLPLSEIVGSVGLLRGTHVTGAGFQGGRRES